MAQIDSDGHAGAPNRVALDGESECRYWSRRFGVRPKVLKRAVREVGNNAEDVEKFLQHFGKMDPDGASHWRASSGL